MKLNPIELSPKKDEFIRTVVDEVARWSAEKRKSAHVERERLRRRRRFGLYAAAMFMTVGLAFLANYFRESETAARIETAEVQQRAHFSAAQQKQAFEHERQRADALAHDLALTQQELETLTARLAATSAARSEAERKLQATDAFAAEQKEAHEYERQRVEALLRELFSAQGEIEALASRLLAATTARSEAEQALRAVQAVAAEQRRALEQDREQGDIVAHELAAARQELETLKLRAVPISVEHPDAARGLQAAQPSAAEQKQALEEERARADGLARDLTSAREEIEALTARFVAAIATHMEAVRNLQADQPSVTEQKHAPKQEHQRVGRVDGTDASNAGSETNSALLGAPMIFVPPTDPAPHARPNDASRPLTDMVAQVPRERTLARSGSGEVWPQASTGTIPGAPTACLPPALRTVLADLEKRFGPLTIVSTTRLHTDNHSPGSSRANLHAACKAVDIKTSREPNELIAYLRSRPEIGGVNSYRNGLVHFDLNANYEGQDPKRVRRIRARRSLDGSNPPPPARADAHRGS
jgi:uncharacterized protein YcbK (DUF882 family)